MGSLRSLKKSEPVIVTLVPPQAVPPAPASAAQVAMATEESNFREVRDLCLGDVKDLLSTAYGSPCRVYRKGIVVTERVITRLRDEVFEEIRRDHSITIRFVCLGFNVYNILVSLSLRDIAKKWFTCFGVRVTKIIERDW
jgi:hypothetical protein